MKTLNRGVFINCPFDPAFLTCFEAIVFTVFLSGYKPVCALQDDNFGNVRLDKLKQLIESCDRSIHDLSRTEPNKKGLPRFNMPFELGVTIGALRYGGVRQRRKLAFVMVKKPYLMPQFLSDAQGQDPYPHHGKPSEVIKLVRNHLGSFYNRRGRSARLPGPAYFVSLFKEFKRDLPALAARAKLNPNEINSFDGGYADFLEMVKRFAQVVKNSGRI
jgi:hypothetical protein